MNGSNITKGTYTNFVFFLFIYMYMYTFLSAALLNFDISRKQKKI